MSYFTMLNTEGFTQERLDHFNKEFPIFSKKNGFDLNDEQDALSANDKFWNELMIHG